MPGLKRSVGRGSVGSSQPRGALSTRGLPGAASSSLCQPDATKSCAACCGLYNWHDHSREALNSLLARRTSLFLSLGDPPALDAYRRLSQSLPSSAKEREDVYNCEFLGFLDEERGRVGCLLHPSIKGRMDLRDRSFYGPALCAGHLCPSNAVLTPLEQAAVAMTLDDWYLYGPVITDIGLVKGTLTEVEGRLERPLSTADFADSGVLDGLRAIWALKETWRFASKGNGLTACCFSLAEYRLARSELGKRWKTRPSRFQEILLSLSSEFPGEDEVQEAESIIEEKLSALVEACGKISPSQWP